MTESSPAKSKANAGSRAARAPRSGGNPISRVFASLSRFVRQILDELGKVVRPTGSELRNYTAVVIVFVLIIMAIVAGMDAVFQRLVLFVFAGT